MLALLLTPAVLSALILGAHFLRRGQMVPLLACLVAAALPALRHPQARRVLQFYLLLGTLEWLRTLGQLVAERRELGEPWGRTAGILGAVAALALFGVALLGSRRVRYHFAPDR